MLTLPVNQETEVTTQDPTEEVAVQTFTEINGDSGKENAIEEDHTNGLIADLAWILLLGAIVTLLFKKLKQPVVLGYILAGFLASPKFIYLPSISNLENIEFWADLGIVVLMFTLGLEFSFRKLLNSGSSAVVTALIIITGMTFAGFGVGKILHLNSINCIFLGGMISMSSTTIILKTLTDLGMRQKKFASLVLAVLIIEDLFAVLMLVLLSSLAMGNVEGSDLLFSVAKLVFFLIIWFLVGVYILPSFLTKTKNYLNNETLLVVAMGLCFSMAIFSVVCGFSLELGAFVMGSILAGTMVAERMEKVVQPVKDLFGAVFFISVGMMVDPGVLATYWSEILLLAVVVICGMIFFGTIGMLATGQTLKVAIESGFTLTQVGEFSFIIASLGMSLGVLEPSLYPIIVAVSVITIFTTPYFVKLSQPAYGFVEAHLPKKLGFLINRYSNQVTDSSSNKRLWREILGRYLWRIVLYSVVLLAIILASKMLLFPLCEKYLHSWGRFTATAITFACMLPFLFALSFSSTKPDERNQLHATASFYAVPLVAMRIIRYLVALLFIVYMVSIAYNGIAAWITGMICFVLVIVFASSKLINQYDRIEKKFMDNLNIRENTRLGLNNNLVGDLHLAYVEVGAYTSFVGDKLRDSGLRRDYGVSVASIQRGDKFIPLPGVDTRIFPGDVIGVIGNDEQIKKLNDDIERDDKALRAIEPMQAQVSLQSIRLSGNSPIINIELGKTNLRADYSCMIVKVQREDDEFENPGPSTVLREGDIVWVVGDPSRIESMQ
ncbi:MAG: sodium:proton antiporter [Bacteroides sp.]|nr:sodium:proton antiporter [Bacteroides sp.]